MASKYTVETGDGYQGVWRARNHELVIGLPSVNVDWPPGTTIYLAQIEDEPGIHATTQPSDSEGLSTTDVLVDDRPILRVPWDAVREIDGLSGGSGVVRGYCRDDVEGLVLVAKSNDPYVDEDSDSHE